MIDKERIISFIRNSGPVIPAQIAKEINQNILMSSAVLSEMVSSKELKISSIKIGGSPLYYLEGQEGQLQNFAHKLNARDKPAYDLLRDRKVLRDSLLPPPVRVSLRALKDFSVPLQVTFNDKKEIFWKWVAASNEEAEPLIKSMLGISEEQKPSPEQPVEKFAEKPVEKPVYKHVPKETVKKEPVHEIAEQERVSEPVPAPEPVSENPPIPEPIQPSLSSESAPVQQQDAEAQPPAVSEASSSKPAMRKKGISRPKDLKDKFMKVVDDFFAKNNIEVISTDFVKKGEVDCIVFIPTVIGKIEYFVKIKSKKSINDTDLNHAYLEGKDKSLNTLFLTNGDLTNKVKDLLNTRYKGLIFKKLATNGN